MAKKQRKAAATPSGSTTHKPKHSLDSNRASKGDLGKRDAATVCPSLASFASTAPACTVHLTLLAPCCLQVRRLQMYKKRAVRDKNGKLLYQVRSGWTQQLSAV
jgi:hypothetical protein